MSQSARGFIVLHAVPFSISKQVTWTISRALNADLRPNWAPQPTLTGHVQATFDWNADSSIGARLASELAGWQRIWFEVSQEPTDGVDASVWFHTPRLGLTHRNTDACGNLLVGENQLRLAMATNGRNAKDLKANLDLLLAAEWTEELEPLRIGAAQNRAVWLAG